MLGTLGVIVPLFISNSAGPWFGLSVCTERNTHRSSANFAVCGSNSLTGNPLCPCRVYL